MQTIKKEVIAFQKKLKDLAVVAGFSDKNQPKELFFIEKNVQGLDVQVEFSNGIYHNSSVTLKVIDAKQNQVECNYYWNRCDLGEEQEQQQDKQDEFRNLTNYYEFSAIEINKFVRVCIRPKYRKGVEILARIGPIEMDLETKFTVSSVLYSGIVNMPVQVVQNQEPASFILTPQHILLRNGASSHTQQCLKILNHLTAVQIEFNPKKGPFSERQFYLVFPKRAVLNNSSILTKVENVNKILLQADSKNCRDYIYIVMQSLAAKQSFIDDKIIANIHNDPKTYVKDFQAFTEAILKYIAQMQLGQYYHTVLQKLQEEKTQLAGEVQSMEEECAQIINTYRNILEEQGVKGTQAIEYETRKEFRLSRRDKVDETQKLKERISILEQELQLMHHLNHTESSMSSNHSETDKRQEKQSQTMQINALKKRLEDAYCEQSQCSMILDRMKIENQHLREALKEVKEENQQLKLDLSGMKKIKENNNSIQSQEKQQQHQNSLPQNIFSEEQFFIRDLKVMQDKINEQSQNTQQEQNDRYLKTSLSTSCLSRTSRNLSTSRTRIFETTPTRGNSRNIVKDKQSNNSPLNMMNNSINNKLIFNNQNISFNRRVQTKNIFQDPRSNINNNNNLNLSRSRSPLQTLNTSSSNYRTSHFNDPAEDDQDQSFVTFENPFFKQNNGNNNQKGCQMARSTLALKTEEALENDRILTSCRVRTENLAEQLIDSHNILVESNEGISQAQRFKLAPSASNRYILPYADKENIIFTSEQQQQQQQQQWQQQQQQRNRYQLEPNRTQMKEDKPQREIFKRQDRYENNGKQQQIPQQQSQQLFRQRSHNNFQNSLNRN